MPTYAFISYRRSDSMAVAQALRVQLLQRFGPGCTFMDVAGLVPGGVWPERLRKGLRDATVVLVIMGPDWLIAADSCGRRRLDLSRDWVRQEISTALAEGKPVIPLLVRGLAQVPAPDCLPDDIQQLVAHQAFSLREEQWDVDVATLADTMKRVYGFRDTEAQVLRPEPKIAMAQAPPLTEQQLDEALAKLPKWEPIESSIPRDYPNTRQELRRVFVFKSFEKAIAFMTAAVVPISKAVHHPRWENQWRTVIVYLSTWDIGNRISKLDVALAHELDAVYKKVNGA